MTEVMVQPGLGLSAPSSRQDVVSALLSAYGSSFNQGDASPLAYSPVPALKELPPPPPPRADSLRNKPLPAVERMSMKFQLRVDQDAPVSPYGSRKDSSEQQPRRRIVMRSLSRGAKPPSLTLTVSNGSTATIPPTPALPALPLSLPSLEPSEDKDLPPPPPEKSSRRQSVKKAAVGQQQAKSARDLARNDSMLSQGETKAAAQAPAEIADASPIVKRKALPMTSAKKFTGLAGLANGPRGGKGGPMPRTSAPRKASVDSQAPNLSQSIPSQPSKEIIKPQQGEEAPVPKQLPPTPEEDKAALPPAPPRKVFTGIGLPSNPRSKGPASPLHVRGKSSTGFNILKANRPAPPRPTVNVNTITPEMTPSPKSKPDEARRDVEISPVSPLSPPSEQRRPFSFETRSESQNKVNEQQSVRPTTAAAATPPASKPLAQVLLPLRTTSPDPQEPSPRTLPSTTPAPRAPRLLNSPPPSLPTSPVLEPPSPPPFTPLTRQPIPLPITLLPKIAPVHLHCYTSHRTNIWSNNAFQPMGCMVCHSNERDRKWACTWCQLRLCRGCSEELSTLPGRDLGALLKGKDLLEGRDAGNPGIVVSGADGSEEGKGGIGGEWVDGYEDRFRGGK